MRQALVATLMWLASTCWAQQGWLPLGRVVDGPYTARMCSPKSDFALHSAIRPYAREDMKLLGMADTLFPAGQFTWLQLLTDPANKWSGGPLVDLSAGPSFGEKDIVKFRAGGGAWLDWSAGPRWTLHVDGMLWGESLPNYLDSMATLQHVTPGEGYAQNGATILHGDWNGYADYKAGEYVRLTLGRGKHFFGEGLRSLFLSDNTYSYPYLRITTTAWRIKYVNLFAAMSDIRGTGGTWREYDLKFSSMHYLSWNALKRLNIGVFEAIVWQDNDPAYRRGFDVNYLNPVMFYRPAEFSLGSPDNALLGFSANMRVGRRSLIYSQLMFDEFLLSFVRGGEGWYGNKQGLQLGVTGHDAFHVKGLQLRAEFNYVRPFMYTHSDTRQNYAHFNQPLAHPYGSNFRELIAQGIYRKGQWYLENTFSVATLGQDTSTSQYSSYGSNIFRPESERPLRDGVRPEEFGFYLGDPSKVVLYHNEVRAGWIIEPHSGLMLEAALTTRVRNPEYGADLVTNYLRIGISTGFRSRHAFQDARYSLPE